MIEDIVNVNISAATATPTRAGFGTPLLTACLVPTLFTQRVRSYTTPQAMLSDGFYTTDPAYKAAVALCSQDPRPPRFKVGRRALPPTQVVELTPDAPTAGKVYLLQVNGSTVSVTATGGDTLASICTALANALNAASGDDADAILSGGASSGSVQTITTFNGVVGAGLMNPPRALQLVLSSHADWDATTAVVTGTDGAGNAVSENFAIPNNGNTTVVGTTRFRSITQVVIPAQSGVGGTFTLGVRPHFTASGASGTKVVVTATLAGTLQSYASVSDTLRVFDATSDPGMATDLAAIALEDSDWYGLALDSNSKAEILASAAWVESNRKLFVAQSADSGCIDSVSTTDVMYALKAASYFRSVCFYHPSIQVQTGLIAVAMLGNRLPVDPGTDTWKFKTLKGITSYTLTDTQRTTVIGTSDGSSVGKNGNVYTVIAGLAITQNGKTSGGEWADVVRGNDWLRARIAERVFTKLVRSEKIAFTDPEIETLGNEVRAALEDAVAVKHLATFALTLPKSADVSAVDRGNRYLPGIAFTGRLAGAIHAVVVNGQVTA